MSRPVEGNASYVADLVAPPRFAFIDRANIGNARLAGLEKDLKLVGYDYNILLSSEFHLSSSSLRDADSHRYLPSLLRIVSVSGWRIVNAPVLIILTPFQIYHLRNSRKPLHEMARPRKSYPTLHLHLWYSVHRMRFREHVRRSPGRSFPSRCGGSR